MKVWLVAGVALALGCGGVDAAETLQTYKIALKGHKFDPAELRVPAGKAFYVEVTNGETAAGEFEMSSPPVEKVVQPGATGRLRIRPLSKGRYKFFDDFHPVAFGFVVAE